MSGYGRFACYYDKLTENVDYGKIALLLLSRFAFRVTSSHIFFCSTCMYCLRTITFYAITCIGRLSRNLK